MSIFTTKKSREDCLFPVHLEKLRTEGGVPVPGKRAVVRENPEAILGVVSNRYRLVEHKSILEPFEESLKGVVSPEDWEVRVSLPKLGRAMFIKYILKDPNCKHEIAVGDTVEMYLELFNSYDGTMSFGYEVGANRLVCTNGLVAPEAVSKMHLRHLGHDYNSLRASIESSLDNFLPIVGKWRNWVNEPFGKEQVIEFFEKVPAPKKFKETIEDKYNSSEEHTKWSFYNALTWYSSHKVTARKTENERLAEKSYEYYAKMFYDFEENN